VSDVTNNGDQAQTPQQRRANAKFAKTEEKKMGKPESLTKKEKKPKPPVSTAALSEFALFSIHFAISRGLVGSRSSCLSVTKV
jgi:hypothetical protein